MLGREIINQENFIIGNPLSIPTPICPVEYVEWLQKFVDTNNYVSQQLRQAVVKQKNIMIGVETQRSFRK